MKKLLSVLLVFIMLTVTAGYAEGIGRYITVSDPYYTDGVNEYDFSGMSVSFELNGNEALAQLVLSVITSADQIKAALEADENALKLYADGFEAPYGISFQNLALLLSEAAGIPTDISALVPGMFYSGEDASAPTARADLSLSDAIYEIYAAILGDAEQIHAAKRGTVSTFNHDLMNAFVVPVELDEEALDEAVKAFLSDPQNQENLTMLFSKLEENGVFAGMIEEEKPSTFMEIYEMYIQPLALSIHGNTYYGDNDIYVNAALYSEGVEILPVYFEVTNTVNPVMYLNIPVQSENGKVILYATIESASDRTQDYVEFGILENENTLALFVFQKAPNEEGAMPVYDLYAGAALEQGIVEMSLLYETDDVTRRKLTAAVEAFGLQFALDYQGAITKNQNSFAEVGDVSLSSNIGLAARAKLGFGSGSSDVKSVLPEETGYIDVSMLTPAMTEKLSKEASALLTNTIGILYEVPFFAQLFASETAEG